MKKVHEILANFSSMRSSGAQNVFKGRGALFPVGGTLFSVPLNPPLKGVRGDVCEPAPKFSSDTIPGNQKGNRKWDWKNLIMRN